MTDRIEEIFQQVMDEDCSEPLRRFADLVAKDAVARERKMNRELLEALQLARDEIHDPTVWTEKADLAIRKATGEQA